MKALVTGANGQLGSDLVPALRRVGLDCEGFGSAQLDITDAGAVSGAISTLRPSVVVNCAAYTKVDLAQSQTERAFAINRDGAKNLAESAKDAGATLIHISTDFVFDGSKPMPYNERDPVNPLGVYGASKLAGEDEVRRATDRHVIIRTSWLYGATGANFVKTILRLAKERDEIRVVFDQVGTPTCTLDLSGAIVDILRRLGDSGNDPALWGTYHYSNEGVASWYDFAVAVVEEAGLLGFDLKCKRVLPILTSEYPTPATRPSYSVFDKGKFKTAFKADVRHWRSALRELLGQLQQNGG